MCYFSNLFLSFNSYNTNSFVQTSLCFDKNIHQVHKITAAFKNKCLLGNISRIKLQQESSVCVCVCVCVCVLF